jgi:hypothetical protein
MIDLNSGSGAHLGPLTFSDRVNEIIDAALIERRRREPVRNYLGASQIGEECARKLCYSYARTPVDEGRELTARAIRIFDTGHAGEDAIALQIGVEDSAESNFFKSTAMRWMKEAGFRLAVKDAASKQFAFTALGGKFAGHIDGKILSGPLMNEIPYPNVGWECKTLNQKNWNKIKKHGVREASPLYYGQMQIYMGYMELFAFLFTATNKNTQELHHELVMYDAKAAQALSDRALTVIQSVEAGNLLPRCSDHSDYFVCKFCDWKKRCWGEDG